MRNQRRTTRLLAGALLLGAGCSQPKIECAAASGPFSVEYTLISGTAPCNDLAGEVVVVRPYVHEGPAGMPDFRRPVVALRTNTLGNLASMYGADLGAASLSSTGQMADEVPGDDGFCPVADVTPASVMLPAVPAMTDAAGMTTPALPPVSAGYQWKNLRFYVGPTTIGTLFSAELTCTRDACTATYRAKGLWPSIPCEKTRQVAGADGKTTTMGTGVPDDSQCSPCPDPPARPAGSGISPAVSTVCDPHLLRCVPRDDPPSLLPASVNCGVGSY